MLHYSHLHIGGPEYRNHNSYKTTTDTKRISEYESSQRQKIVRPGNKTGDGLFSLG